MLDQLYARIKSLAKRLVDFWVSSLLLACLSAYVLAISPAVFVLKIGASLAGRKSDVQKPEAQHSEAVGEPGDTVAVKVKEEPVSESRLDSSGSAEMTSNATNEIHEMASESVEQTIEEAAVTPSPDVERDTSEPAITLSEVQEYTEPAEHEPPFADADSERPSPTSATHSRYPSSVSSTLSTPFDYSFRFPLTPAEEEFATPSTDYSEHEEEHSRRFSEDSRLFGLGLVSEEKPAENRVSSPPASIPFPAHFSSAATHDDLSFADTSMPLDVSVQEDSPAKSHCHVEFASSPTFEEPPSPSIHIATRPIVPKRKSSRIPVSSSMSAASLSRARKPSLTSFPSQSSPKMSTRSRTDSQGSTSSSSPLLPSAPGSLRSSGGRTLSFTRPDNSTLPFPRRPTESPTLNRQSNLSGSRRHSRSGSLPDLFSQPPAKTRKTRQSASTVNQ